MSDDELAVICHTERVKRFTGYVPAELREDIGKLLMELLMNEYLRGRLAEARWRNKPRIK